MKYGGCGHVDLPTERKIPVITWRLSIKTCGFDGVIDYKWRIREILGLTMFNHQNLAFSHGYNGEILGISHEFYGHIVGIWWFYWDIILICVQPMHHVGANRSSVQDGLKPFMRDHITMMVNSG